MIKKIQDIAGSFFIPLKRFHGILSLRISHTRISNDTLSFFSIYFSEHNTLKRTITRFMICFFKYFIIIFSLFLINLYIIVMILFDYRTRNLEPNLMKKQVGGAYSFYYFSPPSKNVNAPPTFASLKI
jgi:hypothetical protein